MQSKNVLISGASIAGPALAYWLHRHGFNATVVERAPTLREGGYAVDFRGAAHLGMLERMGILDEVRRLQTQMGAMTYVDSAGKPLASLPAAIMSGDVEILRGDLSRILYDLSRETTEYIFGDSITALTETADGVEVAFERAAPRTFDLVVGADGLHSNLRALAFGDESRFIHDLGYYVAIFTAANHLNLDYTGRFYNVPGKAAGIYSARDNTEAKVMFLFASPPLAYDRRDTNQQKQLVADRFVREGWEVPQLLAAMREAPDFYFDSLSQIHMESWSRGRIALLGDAGYGATMGGLGTGLAVVAAYVLAGELAVAGGDHRIAFARYEETLRSYAGGCQKLAAGAGPMLAPPSNSRIWLRNQMLRMLPHLPWKGLINAMTTKTANAITLRDYPAGVSATSAAPTLAARP
jgi:2-polyprenyl-6-methoxyphenol hydroxylase-like FAD-dependent oxidoreductase